MKKKKIIKYVLLPFLLIIGFAVLYFYKEYNRVHKDTARLQPDYSLKAASMITEFENDELLSNKKFWDKVVRVDGIVKDVLKDDRGLYSIVLGDTSAMSSVRCNGCTEATKPNGPRRFKSSG